MDPRDQRCLFIRSRQCTGAEASSYYSGISPSVDLQGRHLTASLRCQDQVLSDLPSSGDGHQSQKSAGTAVLRSSATCGLRSSPLTSSPTKSSILRPAFTASRTLNRWHQLPKGKRVMPGIQSKCCGSDTPGFHSQPVTLESLDRREVTQFFWTCFCSLSSGITVISTMLGLVSLL